MKKATLSAIATLLNEEVNETKDTVFSYDDIVALRDEVVAELNKGADAKAAKVAEYESVKEIILAPLDEAIMTVSELYEAIKDELPEGFTRGKVQYALTKLYADEVVKHEGKPCTYGRKA